MYLVGRFDGDSLAMYPLVGFDIYVPFWNLGSWGFMDWILGSCCYLGPARLDSGVIWFPGLDSRLQGPLGLDSSILEPPGIKLGLIFPPGRGLTS